jgi:N6-adenosine-specific RNA methylase IME4
MEMMNGNKYQIIYADPPWDVKRGPDWGSSGPSKELPYPTMGVEDIKGLNIESIVANNAWLFLWVINKYIEQSYQVARAWGFKPICLLTWAKPKHGIGIGGTFIQTTEHLLFCRRGTLQTKNRIDCTWFLFPRGRHSAKPPEFRTMIEEIAPWNTKKVELFARERFTGWDSIGFGIDGCDIRDSLAKLNTSRKQ